MPPTWEVREGDSLERLREMPACTVQCCVTSPPYFGLRDYGVDGQIGLERTPDEFVAALVDVFREVRRVLRDDGTLWLNIGDSYAGGAGGRGDRDSEIGRADGTTGRPSQKHSGARIARGMGSAKPKDLLGIPWLLAFALRADGWYLRSDIIWAKPNPMPESVTDRPTSAHEHVFLLAKSARYFYDADAIREADGGKPSGNSFITTTTGEPRLGHRLSGGLAKGGSAEPWLPGGGRNKRNVWEIATQPYSEAHFATFPPKLVEPCILAGSSPKACGECGAPWERVVEVKRVERSNGGRSERRADLAESRLSASSMMRTNALPSSRTLGWQPSCDHHDDTGSSVVLDPFAGAGTTGVVALRKDRSFIGIELNPAYAEMARERIRQDAPLLNTGAEAT